MQEQTPHSSPLTSPSRQSPPPSPSQSHTSLHSPNLSPTHDTLPHSSHTQVSIAPPNSPPPPLHSLFTTEDSDDPVDDRSSNDNSESEHEENAITFKSFKKARSKKKVAKKKLEFGDDVTESPNSRPKRVDPMLVHSETQRMIRESKLRIPEYTPPSITLEQVLKKLPKLTSPPAKPNTTPPSPSPPKHTTSTPLPKSNLPPSQLEEELPDIDFLSDEPVHRLELTQEPILPRMDILKLRSISTSLPPPKLAPNDITHLDLNPDTDTPPPSTLESFKSRFITQSIGPVRKHTIIQPDSADKALLEEDTDSLLPSTTLSKLSKKPGAAHAFLHDKLRRSLMDKRAQEHRDLQLRIRYENEEVLPSEDSCDVPGGARESEGCTPRSIPDEGSNTDMSCSSSSSSSESESSESSSSEGESDSESEGGNSDSGEKEDLLKAPNVKARRQVLAEDSDSEGPMGEISDKFQVSWQLEHSQPRVPSPVLSNQSTELQLEVSHDDVKCSLSPTDFNLPYQIDYHSSDAILDSFRIPSPSHSQVSMPEGLEGLCDPLTQGGESQLPFLCSARFTQATQVVDRNVESSTLPPLQEEPDKSPVASQLLDDILDADMPVLAPRQIRAKDKRRLKRYRRLAEFEEREAELSGSDQEAEGSDYGSEFGDELDEYESEEGDLDVVQSEEVDMLNAKYYNKIMIQDDEANMEMLKDRFLPEQDIVEDGLRMKHGLFRKRKFNFDDDGLESTGDHEWGEEVREDHSEQVISQERRKRRVERENFIARKSVSSLSDLKYGDTRTLPLADKAPLLRAYSCDPSTLGPAIPSIRKSMVKHNSLLSRTLSGNSKMDPSLQSESNSDSNLAGRKAYVFQTVRSLEGKESSSSMPSLAKSASVSSSSSITYKGNQGSKKTKLKSEFNKDISFTKPTSFFHLLNAN